MAGIKDRLIQFILRGKDEMSPEARKVSKALEDVQSKSQGLRDEFDKAKSAQGLATAFRTTSDAADRVRSTLERMQQPPSGAKLAFDAVTCPFFRLYAAEDLAKAAGGTPTLHVYIREAEPCDEFDAGGMHVTTPLKMKRPIYWHKTPADRAEAAQDTKKFLERFEPDVRMWMDGMDDKLEALYEARPSPPPAPRRRPRTACTCCRCRKQYRKGQGGHFGTLALLGSYSRLPD